MSSKSYTPFFGIAAAATVTTVVAVLWYRHQERQRVADDEESRELPENMPVGEAAAFIKDDQGRLLTTSKDSPEEEEEEERQNDATQEENPLAKMWKNLTDKNGSGSTQEKEEATVKQKDAPASSDDKEENIGFWANLTSPNKQKDNKSSQPDTEMSTANQKDDEKAKSEEKKPLWPWQKPEGAKDIENHVHEAKDKTTSREKTATEEPTTVSKNIFGFIMTPSKNSSSDEKSPPSSPQVTSAENSERGSPTLRKRFLGFEVLSSPSSPRESPPRKDTGSSWEETGNVSVAEAEEESSSPRRSFFGFQMPVKQLSETDATSVEPSKQQEKSKIEKERNKSDQNRQSILGMFGKKDECATAESKDAKQNEKTAAIDESKEETKQPTSKSSIWDAFKKAPKELSKEKGKDGPNNDDTKQTTDAAEGNDQPASTTNSKRNIFGWKQKPQETKQCDSNDTGKKASKAADKDVEENEPTKLETEDQPRRQSFLDAFLHPDQGRKDTPAKEPTDKDCTGTEP